MNREDVDLFRVTEKEMRVEYPELAKIEEFRGLKTKELKFVWYYANRTSPLYLPTKGERGRILACIKYGFNVDVTREITDELSKYLSGNFPEKIKNAIERMERFNPSARLRAKMAVEKIFDNLEASLILDEETKEEMSKDLEMKKKYIELSVKVAENISSVVEQMEQGFGVKGYGGYEKGDKGPSLMDTLHMEDDE